MRTTRSKSAPTRPRAAFLRPIAAPMTAVVLLFALPAFALSPDAAPDASHERAAGRDSVVERPVQTYSPYVMAYDKLDVEDRQGYNSEYIFGMTKGIMKSTLVPALKPVLLLFTVPLDLAFLPFAAVAGFF